jgi:hypothetical protein
MKYKIGYDDPAPLFRDVGSGVWNSESATLKAKAQRLFILGNIGNAAVVVGRHAAAHLSHYFENNGADYYIDLRGMVNDVTWAKETFDSEVKEAIKFAESLPQVRHRSHRLRPPQVPTCRPRARTGFMRSAHIRRGAKQR